MRYVFLFGRDSNRDGEESRSACRPGILSKLRRSERTCYLLEPDICCCEMISSIKKPGHQLPLIPPASWSGLLTVLPARADQAAPGTERPQPRAASPRPFRGAPQAVSSLFLWFYCLASLRSLLRTEAPGHAAFSVENRVMVCFLVLVTQARRSCAWKSGWESNISGSRGFTRVCRCESCWSARAWVPMVPPSHWESVRDDHVQLLPCLWVTLMYFLPWKNIQMT